MAMQESPMEEAASQEIDVEAAEAKRLRKELKRVAKEAAAAVANRQAQAEPTTAAEVDADAEAKRQRKAAKRAEKDLAATREGCAEAVANRQKQTAAAAAAGNVDAAAEANRQKKKAAAEAAAAAAALAVAAAAAAAEAAQVAAAAAAAAAVEAEEEEAEAATSRKRQQSESSEDTEKREAPAKKSKSAPEVKAGEAVPEGTHIKKEAPQNFGLRAYVRGLTLKTGDEASEAEVLRKHFANCGQIEKVEVKADKKKDSITTHIAFIHFANEEGIDAALKLHKTEFGGGTIEVLRNAGQNKVPKTAEQKAEEKKVTGAYVVCIKDLPKIVNKNALNEHFASCGTVARSRICQNGVALIKFADQEGADAALKLHRTDFSGRPIQVLVAKAVKEEVLATAPAGKAQGEGEGKADKEHDNEFTVFVRKLPAVAEAKFKDHRNTIRAHFKDCGQIIDLRVPRDENKTTKGVAFIKFAGQEGYDRALQLNKKDYEGSTLQVKPADKPMDAKGKGKGKKEASEVQTPEKVSNEKKRDADAALKEGSAQDEAPKKKIKMDPEAVKNIESTEVKAAAVDREERHPEVVVKNLPYTVDMAGLILKFGSCGRIQKLQIETSDSKRAKGIAFVKFFDEVGFEAAMKLNDTDYGGRSIFVGSAAETREKTGKGKDGKGKGKAKEFEVFVAGLPYATTEEAFKQRFAEFGQIVNLRFPVSDEGKARGIAFLEYKDKEACEKALKLNQQDYAGRQLTVKMASDESRGKGKDGKGKGRDSKEKAGKATSENKTDAKAAEKPASDSSD